SVTNPDTRRLIEAALNNGKNTVCSADFLGAAVRAADEKILAVIAKGLLFGSLDDLAAALPQEANLQDQQRTRMRTEFAANTLRSLDEFAAVLRGSGGVLTSVSTELLLHFVLQFLEAEERERLPMLDVRRIAQMFRDQVTGVMQPNSKPKANG